MKIEKESKAKETVKGAAESNSSFGINWQLKTTIIPIIK